jgi:hypothetical protein
MERWAASGGLPVTKARAYLTAFRRTHGLDQTTGCFATEALLYRHFPGYLLDKLQQHRLFTFAPVGAKHVDVPYIVDLTLDE